MPARRLRFSRLIGPLALSLLAAACGGGTDDANPETAGVDGTDTKGSGAAKLTGTINISGSSTVAPISTRVADKFADEAPEVKINVDGPGTGDGFVLFCNGETDISDASRPIKKAEADACAKTGVEFIELKVGIDGLTVMSNPANTAVECLSLADLYALAGPESQGFRKWSDAKKIATELGSKTTFPNASFDMSAPGEESGTYDSFVELAIEPIAKKRAEAGKIKTDQVKTSRPDYQSSGDDNIILQGIQGSKTSFGWVGFAYAEGTEGQVKEIKISKEPAGTCVEPSVETISTGTYPLSRYLYLYVNAAKAKEGSAVGAFIDYYLGEGIDAVSEVKYVPLASTDLEATKAVWSARTSGTRDGGK